MCICLFVWKGWIYSLHEDIHVLSAVLSMNMINALFPSCPQPKTHTHTHTLLLQRDLKIDNLQSFFDNEDKNKSDNFERDFFEHKANYYQSKLGIDHVNDSVLLEQAKCYVVGIQWVLHYYYSGVPSWSW